jgi:hypothetical protein
LIEPQLERRQRELLLEVAGQIGDHAQAVGDGPGHIAAAEGQL